MIKKLACLLRNIVGRRREYMGAYYLTLGAIFVPTGFIILLESRDKTMAGLSFLFGMVMILIGSIVIQRDEKRENKKWELQTKIQMGMLDELKKLRGDSNNKQGDDL